MGRFLSPDPLMASAKAWDPQTWNRYVYGRNNPLRMIDPTGMAEVTADQCAKDKSCVSVNLHVIWDKHGNQGGELTDKQKAAFTSGQLQDAKDKWGNADIHFNVTFGSGESSGSAKDLGLEKGSLNVVVTDKGATDVSMIKGGYAVSFVNQNYDHLNTEIGHQFAGDTRGFSNAMMNHLPLGGFGVPDAIADTMNENRLYQADPASMVPHDSLSHFEHYQAVGTINSGARDFQKAITPTTK